VAEEEGATEEEEERWSGPHSATESRGVLHKDWRCAQLDFGPIHDRGDDAWHVVEVELSFDSCSSR
jgi:hypothetical protein